MPDQPEDTRAPDPVGGAGADARVTGSGPATTSWPGAAKGTAAVLGIAAVAAVIAAIVGFSQAGSSDDDAADAEAQRAAAVERADMLEAQVEELEQQAEDFQPTIDELTSERDDAVAENEQLAADLDAANEALQVATDQLDVLTALFPLNLDSSLIPADMPGDYEIEYQEAYCEGLDTCGELPSANRARIYFDDQEFLRIELPGILDAGLFALEGSLYGITDSATALPACGGADRRARITITMYADHVSVDNEGTRVVDDVNASITIDAPSNGPECPSVLVFYASDLNPIE